MTITTEELRKLLDEATPGPWRVESTEADGGAHFIYSGKPGNVYGVARMIRFTGGIASDTANAALTAAAPAIAAELITARAKLEAAEKLAEALSLVSRRCGPLSKDGVIATAALSAWEATK